MSPASDPLDGGPRSQSNLQVGDNDAAGEGHARVILLDEGRLPPLHDRRRQTDSPPSIERH